MFKIILMILLMPFAIVSFYYLLDEYMAWMFGKSAEETIACVMLTVMAICVAVAYPITKE